MSGDNPYEKPESCRRCPLFAQPGIVRGWGPADARIVYVGEAPGEDEVAPKVMRPFVGGAGRIRNAICAQAGFSWKSMFTTNVVKCRPPNNRLPTATEIICCAPFLTEEIERVKPNIIVAAGDTALRVLTDKEPIGLWRGVPLEGAFGTKVLGTWHPAFIIRSQHYWPFAVHDMARASVESMFKEIRRLPIDVTRDGRVAAHGDDVLQSAQLRGAACFDFETTGLDPEHDQILLLGIGVEPTKAIVFDWTSASQRLFRTLVEDPRIELTGQNILNFDLPFAEAKGFHLPVGKRIFDTMVAFHLANSSYGSTPIKEQDRGGRPARGADKDLAFIGSCHTDMPYWKSRSQYKADLRGVCGLDVIGTNRAAQDLKRELKSYDMLDLYYKHVFPIHAVLQRMTKRGLRKDARRSAQWSLALRQEARRLEEEVLTNFGDSSLNLNSPKQLMELLYDKLGLPTQYIQDRKKGRRPTANAEALENLARISENPVLHGVVDVRHLDKLASTYAETPTDLKGFLHPKFGVSKTATGRLNSWNPNGQNWPEEMRDMIVPDSKDFVLISGDWNQIEWRLGMVLSADENGLSLLAQNVDNHRAVAAEALGKEYASVTKTERHGAKFINYGLGYGRGSDSIAKGHNLDKMWVDDFIRRFALRFSGYWAYRDELVQLVTRQYFLANAFKRRRWWYTRQVPEVYNFPMQSNAADMMIAALLQLDAQLPKDSTLRASVHDEALLVVPKDQAKRSVECLRDVMQQGFPQIVDASRRPEVVKRFYPTGWFCPVDIAIATNWKMCKSDDPEDVAGRAKLEKELLG